MLAIANFGLTYMKRVWNNPRPRNFFSSPPWPDDEAVSITTTSFETTAAAELGRRKARRPTAASF
eukprot:1194751-Prorocentrum_minimum.AAC.7